jgi:hypothetical protein
MSDEDGWDFAGADDAKIHDPGGSSVFAQGSHRWHPGGEMVKRAASDWRRLWPNLRSLKKETHFS